MVGAGLSTCLVLLASFEELDPAGDSDCVASSFGSCLKFCLEPKIVFGSEKLTRFISDKLVLHSKPPALQYGSILNSEKFEGSPARLFRPVRSGSPRRASLRVEKPAVQSVIFGAGED